MLTYVLIGLALAFIFFVAFIAVSPRFSWGRADRDPEEVATYIERSLEGTGGEWDWDDFTSVPIRDPELEKIRLRCLGLDREFPPTEAGAYCSSEGFAVLREMLEQLRRGAT